MILCKEENSDLPEMFVAMPFHIFFEFRCPLQKKIIQNLLLLVTIAQG